MNDGGKGSKRRPLSVTQAEFSERYDAIFKGKAPSQQPGLHEPTIHDAMQALEESNMDKAWHILRTVHSQTAYWRERAMQAEAELHAARGQK